MISIDLNVDKRDLYHFGWMLLFILAIYVFANYIVMKDLDQYIEMKNRYNFQKTLQTYIQENAQSVKMKYADYRSYENYLTTMSQQFGEKALADLLSNYFDVQKIDLIERKKRDHIVEERYLVTVKMKEPRSFFTFLEDLKRKSLPLEVVLPIQFQKDGRLTVTFGLLLYTSQ